MAAIFIGPMYCEHGRTPEHCQDCRIALAFERGSYVPTPVKASPPPEPVLAERDLFVDHGDDRYTFVAKGDVIPHAMTDLPRVPRMTANEDTPKRAGISSAKRQ
jgi:hypothetical protein